MVRQIWVGALAFAGAVCELVGQIESITAERVREAVSWLAADERRGRGSGTPELEQAADWLAARFAAAGLKPGVGESWFHGFGLPAQELDSGAVELTLRFEEKGSGDAGEQEGKMERRTLVLKADTDVRQWRASDVLSGDEEITVVRLGAGNDEVVQRLLGMPSSRRPVVVGVGEDHPYWLAAAGSHRVLASRQRGSRPVLLVREAALPGPEREIDGEWAAVWKVAAPRAAEVAQRNVVALLPAREGSDRADEYVIVSAHYDHVGVGTPVDGDAIRNGADDDATGTTAVVMLAEAMAKAPAPRRNVLFVCFAAEERGLLGSKAFCEKAPVPLGKVVACLNIEMIGRPEPGREGKAWITGSELSDFAAIGDAALARAEVGLVEFAMASRLFRQSDNWSLVQKGVVAHSLSAGSLHADYHQPSDEVEKLDIEHMTRIVRGLYEFTRELAERNQPPRWNESGEKLLQRLGGR